MPGSPVSYLIAVADALPMPEAEGRSDLGNTLKGGGTAIGILLLSLLLVFAAPFGTVLMVTFAPLAAGYYGARVARMGPGSAWLVFGLVTGGIWCVIMWGLALALLSSVVGPLDLLEPSGLGLLAAVCLSNILFCVLGARLGASGRGAA